MEAEVIDLTNSPPSPPPKSSKTTKVLRFTAYISLKKIRFKVKKSCLPSWTQNPNASYIDTFLFPQGTKLREPWTHKEHEQFLMGLMEYGGGRWTKIARHFVQNKTPQQVESYATSFFRHLLHTYLPSTAFISTSKDFMTAFASALDSNPKMEENAGPPPTLMLFSDGEASSSTSAFEMETTSAADHGEVDLELRLG